ncbi:MAG: fatty acid desaturase, partial [Cyanobacteria bacterium J06641_5]
MAAAGTANLTASSDRGRIFGAIVGRYREAQNGRAAWQVANTFVPLFGIWALMAYGVQQHWLNALTILPLALPASAFLLRIFGIQHDCG